MNQATIFSAGMQDIWDEDHDKLYDQWANATETAKALGAKETGRESDDEEGDPFVEWEFPDGSKTWIGRKGGKLNNARN